MKILDYINDKSNNAYKDYKLVSVIFDESNKICTFKFLYKDTICDDNKEFLKNVIKEYLHENVDVVVKCKKAYIDCDLVRDVIFNFITRNFESIGVDFVKSNIDVKIDDNYIFTKINCNEFQYNYIQSNNIKQEICMYADGFFFEKFDCEIISDNCVDNIEEIPFSTTLLDEIYNTSTESDLKYAKVDNIKQHIGDVVGCPLQISSIDGAFENLEIAGKIKFVNLKSFESKRKDKEGNAIIKDYYSFTVQDKTGKMNCVYFPNKADAPKSVNLIVDDNVVLIHGDVEEFNGRINFKVKSIGTCDIVEEKEIEEEVEIIKEPFDHYVCVTPEPYTELFQDNLFLEKDPIGDYLLNNDVVVFDIETTGLEASRCEIIEIGAVKLHNGKISETFETLIKPTKSIPEEITEITGIDDKLVEDAPSIARVMPDFYKFCYGATIMAYNIDFDYKFISLFGKKLGYIFDNKQIDVLYLAKAFIPGQKNFKLSSVCKALGVSLENAHRAVHDAMATAEVVIKLSPNIT